MNTIFFKDVLFFVGEFTFFSGQFCIVLQIKYLRFWNFGVITRTRLTKIMHPSYLQININK